MGLIILTTTDMMIDCYIDAYFAGFFSVEYPSDWRWVLSRKGFSFLVCGSDDLLVIIDSYRNIMFYDRDWIHGCFTSQERNNHHKWIIFGYGRVTGYQYQ